MPRRPQRSRKICSVSPSRVPPDQSGTVSPAAISARSASRPRSARVTWVSRVPTVNVSTGPGPPGSSGARAGAARRRSRSSSRTRPSEGRRGGACSRAAARRSRRARPSGAGWRAGCATRRRSRGASAGAARYAGRGARGRRAANRAASRCLLGGGQSSRRRGAAAPRCRWPSRAPPVVGLPGAESAVALGQRQPGERRYALLAPAAAGAARRGALKYASCTWS